MPLIITVSSWVCSNVACIRKPLWINIAWLNTNVSNPQTKIETEFTYTHRIYMLTTPSEIQLLCCWFSQMAVKKMQPRHINNDQYNWNSLLLTTYTHTNSWLNEASSDTRWLTPCTGHARPFLSGSINSGHQKQRLLKYPQSVFVYL